jgi:hypothetical protein
MNAKKNMSRPTIPPITTPLRPSKPLVYTTTKITAINSPNASISIDIESSIDPTTNLEIDDKMIVWYVFK